MVTWLASLEDEDFSAAKLLAELCSKEKNIPTTTTTTATTLLNATTTITATNKKNNDKKNDRKKNENGGNKMTNEVNNRIPSNIPKFRGTKSKEVNNTEECERPTQRRRRANSVIEVRR